MLTGFGRSRECSDELPRGEEGLEEETGRQMLGQRALARTQAHPHGQCLQAKISERVRVCAHASK